MVGGRGGTSHLAELALGIGSVSLQEAEHSRGPVPLLRLEAPGLLADPLPHLGHLSLDQQQLEVGAGIFNWQRARIKGLLQQGQPPLRLSLIQPQPCQEVVGFSVQPQLHRPVQGGFRPFRLPLQHCLPALEAPELRLLRLQLQVGSAAQGLTANPERLAIAPLGHQARQFALHRPGLVGSGGRWGLAGGHRQRGPGSMLAARARFSALPAGKGRAIEAHRPRHVIARCSHDS